MAQCTTTHWLPIKPRLSDVGEKPSLSSFEEIEPGAIGVDKLNYKPPPNIAGCQTER